MVVQSDSHNPPAASAAADQPQEQRRRIVEFDSEHVPLEPPHSVATGGLWRLPSLKASLAKLHVRRSARDTPATMEAIVNVEKQLAALSSLRDVCARIDQRLARAESMSGPRDDTTIDAALRDACAQIYDRLTRVEAAIQRTEGFVADKPWDLAAIAYKRLERVEESLRLTQRSIEDSTLPEMCVNIERQIIQTRQAIQRTEEAVADTHVRELCASIDARLVRTEDSLRRTEVIVAEWLSSTLRIDDHALCRRRGDDSANRTDRLQQDDRADQSSAAVSTNGQSSCSGRFPVAVDRPTHCAGIGGSDGLRDRSADHLDPRPDAGEGCIARVHRADVDSRGAEASGPAPTAAGATPSTTVPRSEPPPSTREERVSTPQRPSPDRAPAPIADRLQTFVGTLSITSVPSGASVSLNGKVAGVTPLRLPRQRAGSLAVQIAQDGFERWSAAVRVPADRLTEVTARLRPVAP